MSETFEKLLTLVGERYGYTADEVYRDIECLIRLALDDPDPETQRFWATIPRAGERPTPEEFVAYMGWKMFFAQQGCAFTTAGIQQSPVGAHAPPPPFKKGAFGRAKPRRFFVFGRRPRAHKPKGSF